MRFRGIFPVLLITGLLVGCSLEAEPEAESQTPAVVKTLPPDDDAADSQKSAQDFRKASQGDAAVYDLVSSVDKIIGEWDEKQGRAFISTKLPAAQSTEKNGELLAGAFGTWQRSESGSLPVSVYGGNGKLIFAGTF
ncbi:hypothetical protein [Streptomyces rubiginosohelvolus]|uniref:hypothetical protein n=1 Tax=Streptomyces rubiginosohelvolus TaxID=67362 RepID=UPI00365FA22E